MITRSRQDTNPPRITFYEGLPLHRIVRGQKELCGRREGVHRRKECGSGGTQAARHIIGTADMDAHGWIRPEVSPVLCQGLQAPQPC